MSQMSSIILKLVISFRLCYSFVILNSQRCSPPNTNLDMLSEYLENDLVSVQVNDSSPRLYVVTIDGNISPLCTHSDDNPTDLYVDPRVGDNIEINDEDVIGCYGEGWFSQRVVPSLGGGPGYGAEANPVWSIGDEVLEQIEIDKVDIPELDLGIAHGEKSRGGAI